MCRENFIVSCFRSLALILGFAAFATLLFSHSCLAQDNQPILENETIPQAADCPPLKDFPQLAGAVVISCHDGKDSVAVNMPLKPDANGIPQEHQAKGVLESREYFVPKMYPQDFAFDNIMSLLPIAGFKVKYSMKPSTITARNDNSWALINVLEHSYSVSVVHVPQEPWTPTWTADEISHEMAAHGRVNIYGIDFAPPDQSIRVNNSKVLQEIWKFLRNNPGLNVIIESHKFSTHGSEEDDLEITRERANALGDWLVAHGIPRERIQCRPFGRLAPLGYNDTPFEIRRNERIVLAQAPAN